MRLRILLIATATAALAAGEPAAPAATLASIRVGDGAWLHRLAGRAASAAGVDEQRVRAEIARRCYLSHNLDGIDLARPAMVAWRDARTPLIAVLPVANRAAFLAGFGATPAGEPPLVRVGDRDGTVVYTQSDPRGLREYRLLINEGVACLAPTAAECRQLAAQAPLRQPLAAGAVIELAAQGAAFPARLARLADGLERLLPGLPALSGGLRQAMPVAGLDGAIGGAVAASGLAAAITATVTAAGDEACRIRIEAQPRSGGPLAAWCLEQRPSHLRNAGTTPTGGIFAAWWSLSWQGALASGMPAAVATARDAAGALWTPAIEEAIRQSWTILDASPAAGISLRSGRGRSLAATATIEHPRAAELAALIERQTSGLLQVPSSPVAVGGHDGMRMRLPADPAHGETAPVDRLIIPADRHLIVVGEAHDAAERAARAIDELSQPAPEIPPAIAACVLDARALAMHLLGGPREDLELPEAAVAATLRLSPTGDGLAFEAGVPVLALAQIAGAVESESRPRRTQPAGATSGPRTGR